MAKSLNITVKSASLSVPTPPAAGSVASPTGGGTFSAPHGPARRQVNAKYDALRIDRRRREMKIERKPEDKILRTTERLKGINLGRNLERNVTNAKSLIHQLEINVAGDVKAQFNTGLPEWNAAAGFWFNTVWARDCDSRDDNHFIDFCGLAVGSRGREGDSLAVFDEFDLDDGKLIFFEADQLVTVNADDWKAQTDWTEKVPDGKNLLGMTRYKYIPMQQADGIVKDRRGRVVAYVVTDAHGKTEARYSEVTVIPRSSAKLLKKPWRFNQYRGTGEFLTLAGDIEDIYEMRSGELQSAKLAALLLGYCKRKDATEENLFRDEITPEELTDDAELPAEDVVSGDEAPVPTAGVSDLVEKDPGHTNYKTFEQLPGGHFEYLDPDDEITFPEISRPNVNIKDFFDFVNSSAGASMGFAKAYTTMSADKSYTAFRGDMILTWATFYVWQKWLERRFLDWAAVKAINWAVRKKQLPQAPEGWQYKISWQMPEMPQVDPEKENNAKSKGIKNGFVDYSEVNGPRWEEKFRALGKQLRVAAEEKLPLDVFETKAGAAATTPSTDQTDNQN